MRVFVYEYLTARGVGREPGSPDHGMYREGLAMRDAVAADFGRIPGVEVVLNPPAEPCAAVLIAPETDGVLAGLADASDTAGFRRLGPTVGAIRLTTDKLALAEHWRSHGIPTPATTDREPTPCEAFPVVWKPRDGAGSANTFRLNAALELAAAKARLRAGNPTGPMILQEFVPGEAASVAFLCGPGGNVPLLPSSQVLSDDGRFTYRGGELPMPPDLSARAVRLGQRAVDCVPGLLGYVGVDLVLGGAADGSRDFAIEINPRLTTSYVGLRQLAAFNLAAALMASAQGGEFGPLRWTAGRVRFGPAGTVTMD